MFPRALIIQNVLRRIKRTNRPPDRFAAGRLPDKAIKEGNPDKTQPMEFLPYKGIMSPIVFGNGFLLLTGIISMDNKESL